MQGSHEPGLAVGVPPCPGLAVPDTCQARLCYHGGAKALLRQGLLYGEPPDASLWAVLYFSVCFKVNICD